MSKGKPDQKPSFSLVLPGVGDVGSRPRVIDAESTTLSVDPADAPATPPENRKHTTIKSGVDTMMTDWLVNDHSMRIEDMVPKWSVGHKDGGDQKKEGTLKKGAKFVGRVAQNLAAHGLAAAAENDEEIKNAVKRGLKDRDTADVVGGLIVAIGKKVVRAVKDSAKQGK